MLGHALSEVWLIVKWGVAKYLHVHVRTGEEDGNAHLYCTTGEMAVHISSKVTLSNGKEMPFYGCKQLVQFSV